MWSYTRVKRSTETNESMYLGQQAFTDGLCVGVASKIDDDIVCCIACDRDNDALGGRAPGWGKRSAHTRGLGMFLVYTRRANC